MTSDNTHIFEFAGFVLDLPTRRLVDPEGNTLNINTRAFDTLLLLVRCQGKTLTKKEIIEHVWSDTIVEENNLNQAIFSLRRSFQKSSEDHNFIKTVSGRGYCFVTEVQRRSTIENTSPNEPLSIIQKMLLQEGGNLNRHTAIFGLSAVVLVLIVAGVWLLPINTQEMEKINLQGVQDTPVSSTSSTESLARIIPSSVAIQPFSNLNSIQGDQYFSQTLHDEVVNQLTTIETLSIISGDPILDLSEKDELSLRELGEILHVESVLSGNIMYYENKARISLQLTDPRRGVILWATSYELKQEDFNNIQLINDDIAINVAKALEAEINPHEQSMLTNIPTASYEAYRLFLAAERSYDNYDIENTLVLTNKALTQDPEYTDALFYNLLAHTFLSATPVEGMTSEGHLNMLTTSAEKLFTLEPNNRRSYRAMMTSLIASKQWMAIPPLLSEFREIVDISDLEFDELNVGAFYLATGDFEQAITIYQARLNKDPLNLNTLGQLSAAYEIAGFPEKFNEHYELGKVFETPWFGQNVKPLISLGRNEPLADYEHLPVSPALIDAFKNINDHQFLKESLNQFEGLENKKPVDYLYYSSIAAYIGEVDLSLRLLEESSNKIGMSLHYIWLPIFKEVRESDEFPAYLSRMGLVEYWNNYGFPTFCSNNELRISCDPQSLVPISLSSTASIIQTH